MPENNLSPLLAALLKQPKISDAPAATVFFFEDKDRTVLLRSATNDEIKYVAVASQGEGPTIFIAMPVGLATGGIRFHSDIVEILRGADTLCPTRGLFINRFKVIGGGSLSIGENGLNCYGSSSTYGEGPHEAARQAFSAAIATTR